MGRPLGINAVMSAAIEPSYGQTPAGGFFLQSLFAAMQAQKNQ